MVEEVKIPTDAPAGKYNVQLVDDQPFYKGELVDVVTSQAIKDVVTNFLQSPELVDLLLTKYGLKAVPYGSLAKNAAVRNGKIEDFDVQLMIAKTDEPVPDDILRKVRDDIEFYELCLAFLDTADDPLSLLGRCLSQNNIQLKDRRIDVIGDWRRPASHPGFLIDAILYRKRFGKSWKTDATDTHEDPFARLRPKMDDILREMGNK